MLSKILIVIVQAIQISFIFTDNCTLKSYETGYIRHLCVGTKNSCEDLKSKKEVVIEKTLNGLFSIFNTTLDTNSQINETEMALKIELYNQYEKHMNHRENVLYMTQNLFANLTAILNQNFYETDILIRKSVKLNPTNVLDQIKNFKVYIFSKIYNIQKSITNKLNSLVITLKCLIGIQSKFIEIIKNQTLTQYKSNMSNITIENYFSDRLNIFINQSATQQNLRINRVINDIQNTISVETLNINKLLYKLSILWTRGVLEGNNSFIPLVNNFKQNISSYFNSSEKTQLDLINDSVQFQYIISNQLKNRLSR